MANKNIALYEGAGVKDFLSVVLEEALSKVMSLEVEALTGASLGERSADRKVSRNGYRERSYDSRLGGTGAADPQASPGELLPELPRAQTHG